MNDLWYEEELLPLETDEEEVTKSATDFVESVDRDSPNKIKKQVRGIIRVNRPRWPLLTEEEMRQVSTYDNRSLLYIVRLGFQFDLSAEANDQGMRYVQARCLARLFPAQPNQPQPTVNQVIPRDYYGDAATTSTVAVKFSPSIQFGPVKVGLGEVSGNIAVGELEPEVIGWSGENECEPYWELRPVKKTLRGERHLWMIVEVPEKCLGGVELALQAEAILESRLFGFIPVGPRIRDLKKRERILIR